MSELLERLGIEWPVVQAGMGGGLSTHRLAAAVSAAGGLGTIGLLDPPRLTRELAGVRERTPRPVAVNLLLPFAGREHFAAAADADVVVTYWGRPRRRTPGVWLHQCGSVGEARAAWTAGADGVIVQGVEAGGHVRGTVPALTLLERTRAALPRPYPVLLAGGVADAADVRAALDAGADAAVLGTRFLMTEESGAHPTYKERLVGGRETVLTELFGLGWAPAPHRVLRNAATNRWLTRDARGPAVVRAVNRLTAPALAFLPPAVQGRAAAAQRPGRPFFSPQAAVRGGPDSLLEAGPLYAGETVARVHDLRSAAELVGELAG